MGNYAQNRRAADGVVQYQILSGQSDMRDNPYDNSVFYPFDGELKDVEFSEAGGLFPGIRGRISNRLDTNEEKRKARVERKQAKTKLVESKGDAKTLRAKAKIAEAKARQLQAKALGQSGGDAATLAALSQPVPQEKSNMPMAIGITVTVLVLGGIGLYLYNKNKNKGK